MSRILFAWELGGGYGHLGPFRPVAEALLARGHQLTVAAREVQSATTVFGALPVRIVQAPLCVKTYGGLEEPPLNFSEILMRYGYLDAPQLRGLLRAWSGLLDLVLPDVLVADHAPTALLAARGRKLGRIVIGTAFAVPPPMEPTPNMRSWVDVPKQRLAGSDAAVLNHINSSLVDGMQPIGAVHEIFANTSSLFTGVPELDPYGPRGPSGYLGLYGGQISSAAPSWPEGEGPLVFAYLSSEYQHVEATLDALAASRARCLVHLAGATSAVIQRYGSPSLVFSTGMLDLAAAVAGSDVCVCHGNVGTVMSILRGGKPMLLLPVQLEHFLLSSKLEELGIARVIHPDTRHPDILGALARVMREDSLSGAAREFAMKHREPTVDTIVARAADRIEALA